MQSHLCLSCSSTIRPGDTHRTPCCASPICTACIARNPRIVDWVPCLRCGDGVEAIKTRRVRAEQFVLEDEEEEDGPPGYDEATAGGSSSGSRKGSSVSGETSGPTTATDGADSNVQEPLKHRIQKGETLRSIANRYAMDPYTLIKLNDLPYTALTTHPTVVQTRQWITLTPSNLRSGAQQPLEAIEDGVSRWEGAGEDDEQRTRERQAKRFQLLTKTPDPLIAKTYLAISSSSSGEPLFSYTDSAEEEKTEKPGRPLIGEDAAVARWFDDEEWEAAQPTGKGKGKIMGSWFGAGAGKESKGKWVSRVPVGVADVGKRG